MLFVCYGADSMYCGLHGMNEMVVIEANSEREAEEYARELSESVINSYSCLTEHLSEEIAYQLNVSINDLDNYIETKEYDEAERDALEELMYYKYYRLNSNCPNTDEYIDYLNSLSYNEVVDLWGDICV